MVFALVVHSMSDTLPTGQLSNVPWRRTGVKYTNNEAYFDVVEEIDVIIDKSGSTVFAEIQGYVSHSVCIIVSFINYSVQFICGHISCSAFCCNNTAIFDGLFLFIV